MRRWLPILTTSLLCSVSTFAKDAATAASDPAASGRALLDRLVGTWAVRFEYTDKTGKARSDPGRVRYSWILDGKALQEIWSSDSDDKDQPFGTTVDFYDPKRQRWTAVWIYPTEGMTMIMTGAEANGGLLLTGHDETGALQRWSTTFVDPHSVVISAEATQDEGKSWKPVGVSYLHRAAAKASDPPDARRNPSAAEAKTKVPPNALFDWILDGKALQSTWTSNSEVNDPQPYGTTVNFYAPKHQHWTALWIYPAQGMTTLMSGGEVNGDFVLTGHDTAGVLQRWSTRVLQADSIVISSENTSDEGKTWRPVGASYLQRHHD